MSKSAARANITDRLEELARPKEHCNDHYFIDSRKPEESITKVKKSALGYEASDRLRELSNPIGFSKDFEMPNLEFWRVKRSALHAKCSDRFDELAKVRGFIITVHFSLPGQPKGFKLSGWVEKNCNFY